MKTIGYILSAFPVLSETFVGNEMRAMQLLGHKVIPIAFTQPKGSGQPEDAALLTQTCYLPDLSIWRVLILCLIHPIGLLRAFLLAFQQTGIRPRSALLTGAKVACYAKTSACQHLHAHFALHSTTAALIAARWLNITVSFVGHGYDVYATPADLPLKLKAANLTVAVCKQMQQDFIAKVPEACVAHIPCGIELSRFQYAPEMKPGKGLLFVGRLAEKKGLPVLLQALASIPLSLRPTLDIVGDGELKHALLQQIDALQLTDNVRLLGARNSSWIIENAKHYIAMVCPFQIARNGDRDTGPLVLKEAMALGLPVISTQLMGCNEIVGDDTGYLVPTQNSNELALAIRKVMQLSQPERMSMLRLARERVELQFNVVALCRLLSRRIEALS